MSTAGKRIVSLFLLSFLCVHFICIMDYAAPVKLPGVIKAAGNMYCYPYFHQQWTVFVPAPNKQFDLMIRNGSGNKWQPWTNITSRLMKRRSAFLGREVEVLLITNSINYVAYDLGEKDQVFYEKPDLPSFKVLERAAKYYFRNFRCWKGGKAYELLLITRSKDRTTAYYFKNLSLL